ncbi:MAG: carbamoyltransferase HypF [Clostridiales bacterium]|nr:carbamoyltransferase HypF [Clostridiales bacterium]
MTDITKKIGVSVSIGGIVQGVGFRPFVHRLVADFFLCGFVRNTNDGVELKLEGSRSDIDGFLRAFQSTYPQNAVIDSIDIEYYSDLFGFSDFRILSSDTGRTRNTLISPDIAVCGDCLRELTDPGDRRYRFPFINCTNCGPRFSIIRDIPYDREKTSMSSFVMCGDCVAEYSDIRSRRYHAQPDCCGICGPELEFICSEQGMKRLSGMAYAVKDNTENAFAGSSGYIRIPGNDNALRAAAELLTGGGICAVKGIGGFHLCCRTDRPELIKELRLRKHRDSRPFAVMCADITEAERFACISEAEKQLLLSPARPIVLLRKRHAGAFSEISENSSIGIMLPYTPLHYLLLEGELRSLIMTSANMSDCPVISDNAEAVGLLAGIADGILANNRAIVTKCDDSVLRELDGEHYFIRRSRGYAPAPVRLPDIVSCETDKSPAEIPVILACGAEQKASFAMNRGLNVFISQHIGDLKNFETLEFYESQIENFERLFDIRPRHFVCDLHPDYLSSVYAHKRGSSKVTAVQHHHAHMASCMADNGFSRTEKCIGIIWDGTGLGTDGTVWGGEFLAGDYSGSVRMASLRSFGLPGGDICTRELWRTAVSMMHDAGIDDNEIEQYFPDENVMGALLQLKAGVNCPVCSSIGRLFDGFAAILGIRCHGDYEGQGAVLLEDTVPYGYSSEDCFSYNTYTDDNGVLRFDLRSMIREAVSEMTGYYAARKHESLSGFINASEDIAVHETCDTDLDRILAHMAVRFMNTLCSFAVDAACFIREKTGYDRVVLSGGAFQNMYLLKHIRSKLENKGFGVYVHHRVSPNDEGIALGQLCCALAGSVTDNLSSM